MAENSTSARMNLVSAYNPVRCLAKIPSSYYLPANERNARTGGCDNVLQPAQNVAELQLVNDGNADTDHASHEDCITSNTKR